MTLWAVHIADGVLAPAWLIAGGVIAAALVFLATRRVEPEEVPYIGLLTAAFFVSSLIHIRVGPTSVHLLLNGLVGVVLGRRVPLAVCAGLTLQYLLIQHGGLTTLGVNTVVLSLPALLGGYLLPKLLQAKWTRHPVTGWALLYVAAWLWVLVLALAGELLYRSAYGGVSFFKLDYAQLLSIQPLALLGVSVVAVGVTMLGRYLESSTDFYLGAAIGMMVAMLTVLLNFLVLGLGGNEDWHRLAILVLIAHLPIVALEGIIVGFAVSFLRRVKPPLLRLRPDQASGNTSDNGTSH